MERIKKEDIQRLCSRLTGFMPEGKRVSADYVYGSPRMVVIKSNNMERFIGPRMTKRELYTTMSAIEEFLFQAGIKETL